jgi:UDP-glucose 4-epimerase
LDKGDQAILEDDLEYDVVVHLAALARTMECTERPFTTSFESNILLTNALLERVKFKKFIYAGSSACYGRQETQNETITESTPRESISIYSAQKLYSEDLVRLHLKEKATVLRFFNVYGPNQRTDGSYPNVIASMLKDAKTKNKVFVTGDGRQTRDFIHVNDVVNAIIASLTYNGDHRLLNICSGESRTINSVAQYISLKTGATIQNIEDRPNDIKYQKASNDLAKRELNWIPQVDFVKGLEEVVDLFKC